MLSIGIVDKDLDLTQKLTSKISKDNNFAISFTLNTGEEVVKYIKEHKPEILIIDDVLSHCSGVNVLRELKEMPNDEKPYTIFTSYMNNDVFINCISVLGANEYVAKPYNIQHLYERLQFLDDYKNRRNDYSFNEYNLFGRGRRLVVNDRNNFVSACEMEKQFEKSIYKILLKSDFSTNKKGFAYIIAAAKLIFENNCVNCLVTKEVYPVVAERNKVSSQIVEYGIRNSIKSAWTIFSENDKPKESIFYSLKKRPTNAEFLHLLAYQTRQRIDETKMK